MSHPFRTVVDMAHHDEGRRAIEFLIARGRLDAVDGDSVEESAALIIARARRRLLTAEAALGLGDIEGAFASAYDAYRMAAEALLVRQGLRAAGGDGGHVTVEDAISAQYGRTIPGFAKATFERLRRTRHSAQYFDPSAPEIVAEDARWALSTAHATLTAVEELLLDDPPELFTPS